MIFAATQTAFRGAPLAGIRCQRAPHQIFSDAFHQQSLGYATKETAGVAFARDASNDPTVSPLAYRTPAIPCRSAIGSVSCEKSLDTVSATSLFASEF
jgi:hypothetical protein